MNALVRTMIEDDAGGVAALSAELGYPTAPELVRERLARIAETGTAACYAAVVDGAVVGWSHVYAVFLVSSPAYAELGGLVVSTASRRRGIGRALVRAAEEWARSEGYYELRLRSGLHRDEAHRFYSAVGYELAKTSHMFRKQILH